ncbi:UNVERIFIED_CONTAM: hypothetical protein Sradi_6835400, partial [Sesamum radiatum]
MESAYRTWLRARRDGLIPQHLDELDRELQMALGTAKWQGRKPFRWVNLDEEDCDDLALFLSGAPGTSQRIKDEGVKLGATTTRSLSKGDEISCQADQITKYRRAWSSPERTPLEIVIDSDDKEKSALIEATPKEKGLRPFFWRSRGESYPGAKAVLMHARDEDDQLDQS